jgi:hypothetical protein
MAAVFQSALDLDLRILFQVAASDIIWEKFYKTSEEFVPPIEEFFIEGIDYIQDKTRFRLMMNPMVTILDIFKFFNEQDPLFQQSRTPICT